MKRILFLISTLNTGGAQRIFSNIITRLPEDIEIDILLNDTEAIAYPYRGNIIDLDMPKEKNKEKISYQVRALIKRFSILRKLKKENHYDACISAMDSANIVNVLTGKKYCKTILTIHGFHPAGWINKKVEPVVDWLMRICYCRASVVVPVSQGLADEMHKKYKIPKERIQIIYNGYNVTDIRTDSKSEETPEIPWRGDYDIVITSGRIEKVKGQWHLIKAFSLVAKENPKARLIILGDGIIKRELEQLVTYLGIEDKVFMPGFVMNPFAFFTKAKVFVLSSLTEGYPNAIAEAMICGLPCIASDCIAGPREMIGDICTERLISGYEITKYGVLTPAFDMDDLWTNHTIGLQEEIMADAIQRLLTDKKCYQELLNHIPEKVECFDMESIISQWEEICLA